MNGFGDDITYIDDGGDVYGTFFGAERARSSQVPVRLTILAAGPLLARAQALIMLGSQPVTKTVTLRAGSSLIEVALDIAGLPETTTIVQTPTTRHASVRTDDLGFTAYNGIIADLYRRDDRIEAVVLYADRGAPVTISSGNSQTTVLPAPVTITPVVVAFP